MKLAVCFIALFGFAFGLPSPVAEINFGNLTANNLYVEPIEDAPKYPEPKVIGGQEVARNSIPYQVAIIINGASFCGGSLITRTAVLTAAHCTIRASFVQAMFAAHNVNLAEAGRVSVTSQNIRNHPSYSSTTLANDIAIILLPSQIALSNAIQIITLATTGTFANNVGLLTGWGRTSDASNAISPVLRRVNLNIITNAVCQSTYGTMIIASTICTSGAGTVGACNGDSGGPLVVGGTQVGVVSFGSTRCAAGNPTAYARVSSYIAWIRTIVAI